MISSGVSQNDYTNSTFRVRLGGAVRVCRNLPFISFGILVLALQMSAQVTTGAVWGYVYDPSGKPVPGAEVNVSDAAHAETRKTSTDGTGLYRAVGLPPSTYSVAAAADRFERVEFPHVVVPVSGRVQLDFRLPISGRKEGIQVTAQVQPVSAESSELGLVLDRKRIESLPLNRRDFLQLALLTPGVSPPVENSTLSSRGAFAMHADGAREEYNNYLLDGADNNDPYVNRFVVQPSFCSGVPHPHK
jgi:Carboxypeptidase regulatory-like domain